jgi:hypothetical protein
MKNHTPSFILISLGVWFIELFHGNYYMEKLVFNVSQFSLKFPR